MPKFLIHTNGAFVVLSHGGQSSPDVDLKIVTLKRDEMTQTEVCLGLQTIPNILSQRIRTLFHSITFPICYIYVIHESGIHYLPINTRNMSLLCD